MKKNKAIQFFKYYYSSTLLFLFPFLFSIYTDILMYKISIFEIPLIQKILILIPFVFIPGIILISLLIFPYLRFYFDHIQINKKGINLSYYRDFPNFMSPAQVSYLYNSKTETKKDLVSNLLSMASKKSIELKFKDGSIIEIKDLGKLDHLLIDEIYLYETIITKKKAFNEEEFSSLIENEIIQKKLYTKKQLNISIFFERILNFLFLSLIIAIIAYLIEFYVFNTLGLFYKLFLRISALFFYVFFIFTTINITHKKAHSNMEKELVFNYNFYTEEGIKIMNKIKPFKRFIQVFSRLKDRELETVYLWEQYLAYSIAFDINHKYKKIKIKDLNLLLDDQIIEELTNNLESRIK